MTVKLVEIGVGVWGTTETNADGRDLSFALARVISCDPEQSAKDEVTECEEHRRMILSP
jgi:hypothetical protein